MVVFEGLGVSLQVSASLFGQAGVELILVQRPIA
jgi:hypothetical protein